MFHDKYWYGRIVDTNDQQKLGRYRVRIHGVHPDNVVQVPTDSLDWAWVSQSVNGGATFFSPLKEGTYVYGVYLPGLATHTPLITGVAPGIVTIPLTTEGANPIQTDKPNGLQGGGTPGQPTIGSGARGDVANTNVNITNSLLLHHCDFRLFVNLGILGGLQNPVTAIQKAIQSGKNRAAQAIKLILTQFNQYLRKIVNGVLSALGLDPTGVLSSQWSYLKQLIRTINRVTKQIAMIVETASFYVNLVRDINMIIAYIKSLPQQLLAMLQQCLTQFANSIKNFVAMLSQLPGMTSSSINDMLSQVSASAQSASDDANTAYASASTSNTSNSVSSVITATITASDSEHANTLLTFITSNFPSANVVYTNSTANNFTTSNMQTP